MPAAIYARYSSDKQSESSIGDQIRLCREWLDRDGLEPSSQTYVDRATSGASMLRPGIQALIEDCMAGRVDLVLAEALDRISRDQADVANLYKRLTFAGIRLVTLAEGEIGDLHVGLKGAMNSIYLKDLAQKTWRGLRGRVEAGRSGGGNSYGYDVVQRIGTDDEPARGLRCINADEARIVIRIFEAYVAGRSPRRIARDLNRDGVPGPSGKAWGPSTINGNRTRGTGILNNELYIGRLVWNRLRYIKNPDTGKRVSRLNPEEEWIVQAMPDLRIVPQALWDVVKERQENVRRNTRPDLAEPRPFWQQTRPRFLLSGLMKCGRCGGSYTKRSANLFGCATARDKGTCNNFLNIRRDVLEGTILTGLKTRLMASELFQVFVEEFTRELNRLNSERFADSDRLKHELGRISRQIDRFVNAIAEGADAKALNAKLKELEARKEELESSLAEAADPEPLIHPNLAALYQQKVEELHMALEEDETREEAMEIIRSLIDKVVLTPVDGELRIDLHGELAGILALSEEGSKKPASPPEKRAEQIKVVAGACSHLYRTSLRWRRRHGTKSAEN